MLILRKIFGRLLRAVLPPHLVRIVIDPILLPGYYRAFADEMEFIIDCMQTHKPDDPEYWAAMLRKYTHILDKGLQRPDFEPGHSRGWYEATKEVLNKLAKIPNSDASVTWAKKKVVEYEHRQINLSSSEHAEVDLPSENDYLSLLKIIRDRRSVRNYSNLSIESEKLEIIADVINWSPTSCNRQPAKVFITTEQELVTKCAATCAGATCFSGSGACFISFCADMRVYNLPEEYLLPNLDIGLGIQNCLLVAHTLGVNITLLSWAQHTYDDDKNLRNLLSIPLHYRIIVNALSGYPVYFDEPPARKSFQSTVVWANKNKT